MKYKTKQPRSLMPLFLVLVFTGLVLFSFSPRFSSSYDPHRIGKYYITMPDSLPKENALLWANKQGDTLNITPYNSREYQLQLDMDSLQIWDGDKLVGKVLLIGTELDSLITKDNE